MDDFDDLLNDLEGNIKNLSSDPVVVSSSSSSSSSEDGDKLLDDLVKTAQRLSVDQVPPISFDIDDEGKQEFVFDSHEVIQHPPPPPPPHVEKNQSEPKNSPPPQPKVSTPVVPKPTSHYEAPKTSTQHNTNQHQSHHSTHYDQHHNGDDDDEESYRFLMNGEGIHGGKVNSTCQFTIDIEDEKTSRPSRLKTGQMFVELSGPEKISARVSDQTIGNQGRFVVSYVPRTAGTYRIDVKWDNQSVLASPHAALVCEHASAPHSFIIGKPSRVSVNSRSQFQIQAKDKFGSVIQRGGDAFEIKVRGPSNTSGLRMLDHNTGLYTIEFTLLERGKYTFSVELGGQLVQGCPFEVLA
eukprot:TRINITY_DN6011_c0_g1_i1.p1 TRINITY_DN6011_c0_g1~~TRINITY_DN6011_c0_g1_i1.p1  ORF type:complete len:367 (+),score=65.48 TRINITY_DN6011_c0_g1_i1:44-1102(+)